MPTDDDRHPDPRVRFAAKAWLALLLAAWISCVAHTVWGWP